MIIGNICELLHCLVQTFLRLELIQVDTLILQCVEVAFHRGIVIRISGFAHALRDMSCFAEFDECFGCVLCALVTMQDQLTFACRLWIQCFLQGTYRQATGDVPVSNTGNHAPVMKVYDAAVVPYFMIFQEQVCEIRAPFLVGFIRSKILPQLVFEYLMWFSVFIIRLFRTDNGAKPHFHIHVFVYGGGAVGIAPARQIDCHAPVTVNTVVFMIDFVNLCLDFLFMGIITRLPVFPVVVVCIRIDIQPVQQPADAEFVMVFFDESISL